MVLDLKIIDIKNPNKIADDTPADADCNPPVNMPNTPFSPNPLRAPLTKFAPNPVIGTVIPAPANSSIVSKTPIASKKHPNNKKVTSIRAEVILVKLISICPSKQTNPPTANTFKY